MRGRGGNIRGRGKNMRPPFLGRTFSRPVYDEYFFTSSEETEQKDDESGLAEELRKKDALLKPTLEDEASLRNLLTKITGIADNLIVAPGSFTGCQLEEVRAVGSFKKNTMTRLNLAPDVVFVLKTLPMKEAVEQLAQKVNEDLRAQGGILGSYVECNNRGFTIHAEGRKVHCLVATIPQNIRNLDRELHLDAKVVIANSCAIKHSRWFEENGHHPSVRVLARVLRDLAARFPGLNPLKPWIIDFLAHHCIMVTESGYTLSAAQGFHRALALLAAGIFLPLSSSIADPIADRMMYKIHGSLPLEDQDLVCMTAQSLVRILHHGGWKQILGLEGKLNLDKPVIINGITISPQERVYERPVKAEDGSDNTGNEEMENEENMIPAMLTG
ncbi:unnamed protein product [Notodromas monacha]|uniref:DZF domain-containing protein n=1 Tax=Notodromas monacha TaxID=399045 RepID=A0A7R9GCD3_9CRUS|nr:unnamed protein product [Notodromas monacha]CAG0915989.1 unnamed protein product [Notodromas monacha]